MSTFNNGMVHKDGFNKTDHRYEKIFTTCVFTIHALSKEQETISQINGNMSLILLMKMTVNNGFPLIL
jgi:hypothetical protein